MARPYPTYPSDSPPWPRLLGSLVVALLLNLCPWPENPAIPDALALTLLFWSTRHPSQPMMLLAFALGLLMDTHLMSALGEHALRYTLIVWLGIQLRRRMRWFGVPLQMLHVLLILLFAQAVLAGARLIAGLPMEDHTQFLHAVSTTLLWPVLTLLFGRQPAPSPRQRPTAPYLRTPPPDGAGRHRRDA